MGLGPCAVVSRDRDDDDRENREIVFVFDAETAKIVTAAAETLRQQMTDTLCGILERLPKSGVPTSRYAAIAAIALGRAAGGVLGVLAADPEYVPSRVTPDRAPSVFTRVMASSARAGFEDGFDLASEIYADNQATDEDREEAAAKKGRERPN